MFTIKRNTKHKINKYFKQKVESEAINKSKLRHLLENKQSDWIPGKRPEYMNRLTRNQASIIFKARTRMLNIKDNFKKGHPNQTCRICDTEPETQIHILTQCPFIHKDDSTKVNIKDIFDENVNNTRTTAKKMEKIMSALDQIRQSNNTS